LEHKDKEMSNKNNKPLKAIEVSLDTFKNVAFILDSVLATSVRDIR